MPQWHELQEEHLVGNFEVHMAEWANQIDKDTNLWPIVTCKKTTYFCTSLLSRDSFIYFSSTKHVCITEIASVNWFGSKIQT